MDIETPKIAHVDRVDGSVVETFDDGQSALYSAALLYEMRTRARDLTDLLPDDEQ